MILISYDNDKIRESLL